MAEERRTPRKTYGDAIAAEIEHPVLRELFAYWASKKRGGNLPRLADLDPPGEIPRLTAAMSIVLVEGDPPRFKYKRMGSAIVANRRHLLVHDATGRYFDEIDFNTPKDQLLKVFTEAARQGRSYREINRFQSGEFTSMWYEWLLLPMSGDGVRIDALMTGYVTLACQPSAPTQS